RRSACTSSTSGNWADARWSGRSRKRRKSSVAASAATATASPTRTTRRERMTLFKRIGGAAAVVAAVEIFYQRVLADPLLERYFSGVDMESQMRKLRAFLTVAFGGAPHYDGRNLRNSH